MALFNQTDTVVVVAQLPRAALTVRGTFKFQAGLVLFAMHLRIAKVIGWTKTVSLVVDRLTEGANSTSALSRTGIDAFSVKTRLLIGTVGIRATANETPVGDAHLRETAVLVLVTFFLFYLAAQ